MNQGDLDEKHLLEVEAAGCRRAMLKHSADLSLVAAGEGHGDLPNHPLLSCIRKSTRCRTVFLAPMLFPTTYIHSDRQYNLICLLYTSDAADE